VWRTSRVEIIGCDPEAVRAHYGKVVIALWHEEVFFVAWAFSYLRPSTLASRGDFGELITRMLELCDYEVFRGGSSAGKSRNSPQIVRDMIDHMRENRGILYGLTVDGSNGPRYRAKPGAAKIAAVCRAPIVLEKTWCRRRFRLRNWDRTIIPLPFNHIVHVWAGPYLPPADVDRPIPFKQFAREMERELWRLTESVWRRYEGTSAEPRAAFPPEWSPSTEDPVLVRPFDAIPALAPPVKSPTVA
ncbi:MAG: lysophospholipid acyltransferase family protein, partial [Candidatus Binatia bacterium]